MSTRIVPEASIAVMLLGRKIDEAGIASDPELSGPLRMALAAFASFVVASRTASG
jgi:hypothetical protein